MAPVTRFFVTYVGRDKQGRPKGDEVSIDGPRSRVFPRDERVQVTHEEWEYFATRTAYETEKVEFDDVDADPIAEEEALAKDADLG